MTKAVACFSLMPLLLAPIGFCIAELMRFRGRVLALAHNGNVSNGWMFPVDKTYAGGKVDKTYVEQRSKWEPLYEVTQIKGDGEAHPRLSPTDEFSDYGTWDKGDIAGVKPKTPEMLPHEYARSALQLGLQQEAELGVAWGRAGSPIAAGSRLESWSAPGSARPRPPSARPALRRDRSARGWRGSPPV